MSEENEVVDGLISRLTVIDQQPLERRAVAFAQIHDELRAVLDGTGADGAGPGVPSRR
ncbi:hypothetical protein GCM10025867_24460 [Frondihabitans sucicola]|uniref:Uncharacterized protein n=1 Tax=Frondihabitans sucicola TaxID=1268041 RepID=A0ABM8GPM2_9MICO|nr:hypothetical protein [Frondihabitans sucicola]BDZ50205.1 hypothetical protein GCM10025867_24460 [Frondihabitans sucicola]